MLRNRANRIFLPNHYYGNSPDSNWSLTSGSIPWTGSLDTYSGATGGGGFHYYGGTSFFLLYSNSTSSISQGQTMTWNASATFLGNYSSFGLTPGSGTFTFGNGTESVSVNWSASSIPEPSTYAAIVGVGGLAFALWRRRSVRANT